ncbi:MAG TPA: phosphoribosyl-AMP cyclohydrolase [Candidatus Caldiarchaeum subterraneum]|uniref:Phosphoribosyl-AMP cyclohydrolase n=1 Tax=Caldiarchaeum subterraneum TaxID=311458 RepID=A0A832ZVW6_CALS0|nr:phosphoribosyl-AMP cyclohydrolase [Candidatus Caldarchaeum subterraneum]
MKLDDVKFDEKTGLVPVIVQDVNTREVLMLAYANREALKLTMREGIAHFWSRSRRKLWMKGEESGNIQYVKEILLDCDYDAVLYLVEPTGPACHTGERTCFHNRLKKTTESSSD